MLLEVSFLTFLDYKSSSFSAVGVLLPPSLSCAGCLWLHLRQQWAGRSSQTGTQAVTVLPPTRPGNFLLQGGLVISRSDWERLWGLLKKDSAFDMFPGRV